MKTRAILFFAALAAGVLLSAQVKTHEESNIVYTTNTSIKKRATFEYPSQTITCKGKRFEAKTTVEYLHYRDRKGYNVLQFCIRVKPLDVSGLDSTMRDLMAPDGSYGTQIVETRLDEPGYRQRIKGTADVYARTLSASPCRAEDMLKLKYDITFDVSNMGANKSEYKISQGRWAAADAEAVSTTEKEGEYKTEWWFDLQGINPNYQMRNDNKPLKNRRFAVYMSSINDACGTESAKRNTEGDNPGRITSCIKFSINGENADGAATFANATPDYPSTYDKERAAIVYTTATGKKDGEVTMQHSARVRITDTESYNPEDFYKMDFRAYAKCKYHKDLHSGKRDALYYEKATFSCMIHP